MFQHSAPLILVVEVIFREFRTVQHLPKANKAGIRDVPDLKLPIVRQNRGFI
jgi:hypothetical protein